MDRLNREAVANWPSRQHDPIHEQGRQSAVCTTEYNGLTIDLLIAREWLNEDEAGDPKAVGRAISEMLAEAATAHWKETH